MKLKLLSIIVFFTSTTFSHGALADCVGDSTVKAEQLEEVVQNLDQCSLQVLELAESIAETKMTLFYDKFKQTHDISYKFGHIEAKSDLALIRSELNKRSLVK